MNRHFSIPTVLRMTPKALLRNFFNKLGYDQLDIPWNQVNRHRIGLIQQALEQLSPQQRSSVETALHDVFDLACDRGAAAIYEAAGDARREGAVLYLPDVGGPYCLAIWTWLSYPRVFERALLFQEIDNLGRWRKRADLPQRAPRTSADALADLARAVSHLFYRHQGRGRRCTVEHAYRSDYFFAYPDDFVQIVTVHDEAGKLTPRPVRRTFEIVLVYDRREGTLETNAQAPSPLKLQLEEIFCQTILGQGAEPPLRRSVYNLAVLKEVLFQPPTDPADCVAAKICSVRLALPKSPWSVELKCRAEEPSGKIASVINDCLNQNNVPLEQLDVLSARFRLEFGRLNGRKQGSLTFDVSSPDACSLRSERPERVALALKYLKSWRITR